MRVTLPPRTTASWVADLIRLCLSPRSQTPCVTNQNTYLPAQSHALAQLRQSAALLVLNNQHRGEVSEGQTERQQRGCPHRSTLFSTLLLSFAHYCTSIPLPLLNSLFHYLQQSLSLSFTYFPLSLTSTLFHSFLSLSLFFHFFHGFILSLSITTHSIKSLSSLLSVTLLSSPHPSIPILTDLLSFIALFIPLLS